MHGTLPLPACRVGYPPSVWSDLSLLLNFVIFFLEWVRNHPPDSAGVDFPPLSFLLPSGYRPHFLCTPNRVPHLFLLEHVLDVSGVFASPPPKGSPMVLCCWEHGRPVFFPGERNSTSTHGVLEKPAFRLIRGVDQVSWPSHRWCDGRPRVLSS